MATILIPCLACRAGTPAEEDASSISCTSCGTALPPPGQAAWLMTRSGSDQFGPYTLAQLGDYIAEGRILPNDGIWYAGASVRLNVHQLPLFGAAAAAPVAPAPAPAATMPAPAAPQPVPGAAPAYAPAPAYAAPQQGGGVGLHFRRALSWNLRAIVVEPEEEAALVANGVDEADARRFLVWRRSVLLVVAMVTLLPVLLKTIEVVTTNYRGATALGTLLNIATAFPIYAIPLTAWFAAKVWDQHRRSRTILLRGWLFAFLMPLFLALFPITWRIDMSQADQGAVAGLSALISFFYAAVVYVTLMPAVLALIPGVLRACLRIKALIPESILPGLFLVAATPLYVLLFLVIFTTVNQVAGNGLLILGVLALTGAPLLYLVNGRLFTKPLRSEEEVAKIGSVQNLVLVVMAVGVGLLVLYAFTTEIFGKSLIGTEEATSIMRPWSPSLFQFPIEYFVRSLFTTVLVADMFMLMNLSLWRHSRELQGTPEAASYDRLMSEIEEAGGAPQPQASADQVA